MVFEFELELHLMLVWGHFFEFNWLLLQSAEGWLMLLLLADGVLTVLVSAAAKKQPAERGQYLQVRN